MSNEKIKLINEKSDLNRDLESVKEECEKKKMELACSEKEKEKMEEKLSHAGMEREALLKQMKSMKVARKEFENEYEELFLRYEETQNNLNRHKQELNLKSIELDKLIKKEEITKVNII